jgi:hypothetical protein
MPEKPSPQAQKAASGSATIDPPSATPPAQGSVSPTEPEAPPRAGRVRVRSEVNSLDDRSLKRIADNVYVMALGGVIARGVPTEIIANPAVIEIYLGKRA